ncbi:MAG: hypothetical protein K8S99_15990 [Planctomycetes bacterium]|nr:hypothetical protein [Planctomycetota bacterium]
MLNVVIPMPLQVVLDDVGWWSGEDGHAKNEPFRTGIPRGHVPADYAAIVSLGRQLGMAPAGCFIIGEWDTKNLLRKLPRSQWMGEKWDNNRWVGPWLEEAADIIRSNRDHFELALHGITHEFWENGKASRAEWHDCYTGVMRPYDELHAHLDMFATLLDQHGLGPFPTSFCPCAGGFRWGAGEKGIDGLLSKFGVRYTNTPFHHMARARATQHHRFGIDCGVLTVDRQPDLVSWFELSTTPTVEVYGPIAGMHWPNILHADPSRNEEAVAPWVAALRAIDRRVDRTLSRNTADCFTQYVHHLCVRVAPAEPDVTFDFTELDALPPFASTGEFTIKLHGFAADRFTSEDLDILSMQYKAADSNAVLKLRRKTKSKTAKLTRIR